MNEEKKDPNSDLANLPPTEDSLIKDTTVKEKYDVFEISKRISKYFSGLLFITGAMSILVSVEYFAESRLFLLFGSKSLFLFVLGFVGAVNLVCGLLLLTKE